MTLHRLEVYVDSYRSRPFIKDFEHGISLSPSDEKQLEDWIGLLAGREVKIERQLRIEDVKHHFLDSVENFIHSTCVRVSIVD